MHTRFDLEVVALAKQFETPAGTVCILDALTCLFSQEKTYALMGASGSGKSTLMHLLAGLDEPSNGTVLFGGVPISAFDERERAQKISIVFQHATLISELSVLENVIIAGVLAGNSWDTTAVIAQELLDVLGVGQASAWQVGQLSGGQRQRVALARALINQPAWLLADELTGSLDRTTGVTLMQLVLSLTKQWSMGCIMSTHNPEIAGMMDTVFELNAGKLVPFSEDAFFAARADVGRQLLI